MKIQSLTDLFQHELQDLYDAEYRIARALEKTSKKMKRAWKLISSMNCKEIFPTIERFISPIRMQYKECGV